MSLYDIIRRPLISEKGTQLQVHGQYLFEVLPSASKPQIRQAVEKLFKVKVVDVRTATFPGKTRRVLRGRGGVTQGSPWKKAIITLAEGQKLEFIEGV